MCHNNDINIWWFNMNFLLIERFLLCSLSYLHLQQLNSCAVVYILYKRLIMFETSSVRSLCNQFWDIVTRKVICWDSSNWQMYWLPLDHMINIKEAFPTHHYAIRLFPTTALIRKNNKFSKKNICTGLVTRKFIPKANPNPHLKPLILFQFEMEQP